MTSGAQSASYRAKAVLNIPASLMLAAANSVLSAQALTGSRSSEGTLAIAVGILRLKTGLCDDDDDQQSRNR